MTDEEKAEEYNDNLDLVKERNPELKTNNDFIKQAYLDGLTEGRKEVTYMTAKEYNKTLDKCKECYLDMVEKFSKRNAELKKQDKICEEIIIGEQIEIDRLNKENKELKALIEKMKLDQKTSFDKGMKHLAKELKEYDRINGAWSDYFEHTVNKVLKWELARK